MMVTHEPRASANRCVLLLPLALLVLLSSPVCAEVVLASPGTDGWRPLEFPKIQRHTTYAITRTDGLDAVRAESDCAGSALYLPVEQVDLQRTPLLHWRWKIEQGLQIADERVKAGDDFAARVYIMFRFDAAHASMWEQARHRLGTVLYASVVPGHAIDYVWTNHQPAGASWDNPFASEAKMVSLGSGPLPQWADETVDVAADYVRYFGHPAPPLLAIALMTDSDNSCQHAVAEYADFRFVSR